MIIFKYDETKLSEGFYITEVDEEKSISYYDGDNRWEQMGIDYDIWYYGQNRMKNDVHVIAKVDINNFTIKEIFREEDDSIRS